MIDIPNRNIDVRYRTPIYWGGIFAGALVALGLGFLLQLFGIAIGLSVSHSDTGTNTLAIGGAIATIIGIIISMGLGGFVAGYHGHFCCCHRAEGFLYGFLTWCIALLLSAVLIFPLSQYAASSYTDNNTLQVSVSENLPQHAIFTKNAPVKPLANQNAPQTDLKITPAVLAGGSWLIFILFLIGALSSCIGGASGMGCKSKHRHPEVQAPLV